MANPQGPFGGQTHDPAKGGGQFMKRETREALNARHVAETWGQSAEQKKLAADAILLERESSTLQRYISPILSAVQSAQENPTVAAFKALLPVLAETQKLILDDTTLDDKLQDRALAWVRSIHAHVNAQVRHKTRKTTQLKNLVRQKAQGAVEWAANSDSFWLGLGGRALQRRQERKATAGDAQNEAGQAAAGLRAKMLGLAAGKGLSASADDLATAAEREPTPPQRTRRGTEEEKGGTGGASVLAKILTTDKGILKETRDINKNLGEGRKQDAEQFEATDKEKERTSDKASLVERVGASVGGPKGEKGAGGLFGQIGKLFGKGSALEGLASAAKFVTGPLKLLGAGALVIGAAFAGWKIGEMIGKWTGATALVERAASWFADKLGLGGYGDAKRTEEDRQKRTKATATQIAGREITDIKEAEQIVKDRGDQENAAKAQASPTPAAAVTTPAEAAAPAPLESTPITGIGELARTATASTPAAPAPPPPAPAPPVRVEAPTPATPQSQPERAPKQKAKGMEGVLRTAMEAEGITDPVEQAALLSQVSHETGGFRTLEERYNGDKQEYFNNKYGPGTGPGRAVGNTQEGDGYRFRGRGFVQLTGRSNYEAYGKAVGVDLLKDPDKAAEPQTAARIAVAYWKKRVRPAVSKNAAGDFRNVAAVTKAIQGGAGGLEDRTSRFAAYMGATPAFAGGGPAPARSGTMMAAATTAAGRTGGAAPAPTVVAVNNVTNGGGGGTPTVLPIAPDNRTIRGVTGAGGSALG